MTRESLTKEKEVKKRIAWLDNVKFFAMLCVIMYHSTRLVKNEMYYAGWVIESFNMALFFFISGLTSYHSIVKIVRFRDLVDFYRKKFIRILLPCVFVSLLVFQKPCAFWFLLTLFYYIVSFASFHYVSLFFKISKSWAFIFFLLLLCIDMPKVGNNQEFVLTFALGMYMSKNGIIDKLSELSMNKVLCVVLGGFTIWLLLLPFYNSFYLNPFYVLWSNHIIYIFVIRQVIDISFAIACCLLFLRHFNKLTKFSEWGGQTLGMYIIHVTILTIIDNHQWVVDAHGRLWGNLLELVGFVLLTIITMLLVRFFRRWKWTSFFILGY